MNETIWKTTVGSSKQNLSEERILLLLIARGLPMHSDVHTINTKCITGCLELLRKEYLETPDNISQVTCNKWEYLDALGSFSTTVTAIKL
jgi:hypothetical protein